ncbi:MAG: hypothetical protein K5860_06560 [Bacteroidales bacterium]|nr:hypothetical protein [Bacteroidales bacterium]
MKDAIVLDLPIQIRRTVNRDGYVIRDAKQTEFFFYEKGIKEGEKEEKLEKIAKKISDKLAKELVPDKTDVVVFNGLVYNKRDCVSEIANRACFEMLEKEEKATKIEMDYDGFCSLVPVVEEIEVIEINGVKVKIPKTRKARNILYDGKRLFDEKWIEERDKNIVKNIKKIFSGNCGLSLEYIAKHKENRIIKCGGGKNGNGKWTEYLSQWLNIFTELNSIAKDVWLIELENDDLDDVFDLYIGIKLC